MASNEPSILDKEPEDSKAQGEASKPKEETPRRTVVQIIKANPAYAKASNIVLWNDPVKSGLLFGIFNLFYYLITFGDYTVVTLISYVILALLVVCFGYSNFVVMKAAWINGKRVENPFTERFKQEKFHITQEQVRPHVETFIEISNVTIDTLREAFYCTNNFYTLQVAAVCYALATVGAWFGGATLIYLTLLVLFVWPRLYQEKQREIDQLACTALQQASNYYNLALSKVPPAVYQRFPALKPKST